MREIKFRQWQPKTKRFLYIYQMQPSDTVRAEFILHDGELQQYTGFKDKNGEEIYYGDIYICHTLDLKRVVDELTVAYWIIDEDRMNNPMRTVEVIGNIYENPEILK